MAAIEPLFLAVAVLALLLLTHVYVFYPLSLLFLKRKKGNRDFSGAPPSYPSVAMVCAAHNEDQVLEEKIRNFLAIDYPPDKLCVYFGSDGSTDRTDEILLSYSDNERIRSFMYPRRGKAAVINELMRNVEAEIVAFSDANTLYAKDAIGKMVRRFSDPSVGGVCGNLHLSAPTENIGMAGEEKYWFIETWLKKMESSIDSLIGATGGIYAIRRALFEAQPEGICLADDLLLPVRIAAKKYRIVFEEQAHAFEETNVDIFQEFQRRVRIAVGSLVILSFWSGFSAGLSPFFKYSFFSHKLLRWLIPFILIALLLATGVLTLLGSFMQWLFFLQLVAYGAGLVGLLAEKLKIPSGVLVFPAYFLLANAAVFVGWFKRSTLGKQAAWSTQRTEQIPSE
jgi:poly-beta-1,6-N-acetyl-D-glucosamine synthase